MYYEAAQTKGIIIHINAALADCTGCRRRSLLSRLTGTPLNTRLFVCWERSEQLNASAEPRSDSAQHKPTNLP